MIAPSPARAGAWLQPEGEGQIIFNPMIMQARQRFDRRGRALPTDRFIKSEGVTLIEYGFRDDLTLMLATRQRSEAFLLAGDPQRVITTTLGFGARTAILRREGFILSAQITADAALERSLPALDRRFGARHEVDARVLAGQGFSLFGLDAFAEAQAGYRWRSGRFADEARLDLTLGLRPHPSLLVLLQSLNSFGLTRTPGDDGRQRQHKLQAGAVLDITERWSLHAAAFASIAGRNSLKERGAVLGVWRKF